MDLAGLPALVFNLEPLVPLFDSSECAKLLLAISQLIILANIVIENSIIEIVTNVVNINGELLVVPLGFLASLLADLRLPSELA